MCCRTIKQSPEFTNQTGVWMCVCVRARKCSNNSVRLWIIHEWAPGRTEPNKNKLPTISAILTESNYSNSTIIFNVHLFHSEHHVSVRIFMSIIASNTNIIYSWTCIPAGEKSVEKKCGRVIVLMMVCFIGLTYQRTFIRVNQMPCLRYENGFEPLRSVTTSLLASVVVGKKSCRITLKCFCVRCSMQHF